MDIFLILGGITVLFFVLLIVKHFLSEKLKEKFCVICASVSLTWITLLILYWLNTFENTVVLALLMGLSTLGIFYLVERTVRKRFTLFRLPFLLTLITIALSLLSVPADIVKVIILLSILWVFFILIYFYRNNENLQGFVKKIVECCKNW